MIGPATQVRGASRIAMPSSEVFQAPLTPPPRAFIESVNRNPPVWPCPKPRRSAMTWAPCPSHQMNRDVSSLSATTTPPGSAATLPKTVKLARDSSRANHSQGRSRPVVVGPYTKGSRSFDREPMWWLLSAACKLLTQGCKSFIAGQRAFVACLFRGERTGGRSGIGRAHGIGGAGFGVRCDGLGDLLLVLFPAFLSGGVLLLPGLALSLVALDPFVGLGVEALGVLVVAVLVVLLRHAVESGVKELLGLGIDALVRLLQRQRDAATLEVDVDDLDVDGLVDGDDLLGQIHVAHSQLGDVDEALDAVLDAHERTEGNELGDLARHDLSDHVGAGEVLPRIFLSGLERQRNALTVHIDVEDLDGDLVADGDDLTRVIDVLPGQLGDVDESVDTTEVDEGTEVDDGGHDAGTDLALLQGLQEVVTDRRLGLLEPGTAGQDHIVAVLVEFDDLGLDLLADVGGEVADATHLDQGRGQEAAQSDVDDQAALDDLDDGAGDNAVVFLDLLDVAPGALVLSALLREHETAFLEIGRASCRERGACAEVGGRVEKKDEEWDDGVV